jgi:glycosyltransferase involved in cell wall biosynthesis
MKVSVVIPVYNEEKHIKTCLDSLTNQARMPDEIIVVDNNCTDKTISIVKKYPKVTIIEEKKQGITPARNAGFNTATGEIIARCDADTILPKDWVKKIEEDFKKDKKIVALTTYFYIYDILLIKNSLLPTEVYYYFANLILKNPSLVGYSLAIKKDVWDKVKKEICVNDKKVHEDIDLGIHVLKYGKIYLDKTIVVKMSGRRIKHNPLSFFIEYPIRLLRMLKSHRNLF